MAAGNWLEDAMTKVRQALRSVGGDEGSRAREAVAEATRQKVAARQALSDAESERTAAMRRALDGDVDAGTLKRLDAAVEEAERRVKHADVLVKLAQEKLQRAEHNEVVRKTEDRWATYRARIDELDKAMRRGLTACRVLDESVNEVRAASAAARAAAPVKYDYWPDVWTHRLSEYVQCELVRLDGPKQPVFKWLPYPVAFAAGPLEERHKASIQYLLQPDPTPKPNAA